MTNNNTHIEIWNKCLEIIKDNVAPLLYNEWFLPIVPKRLQDKLLTIQVPTMYFQEKLEKDFISLISKTLVRVIGVGANLSYEVVIIKKHNNRSPKTMTLPTVAVNTANKGVNMYISAENSKEMNPHVLPGLKTITIESYLTDVYSFDAFIEGECNKTARYAGLDLATHIAKKTTSLTTIKSMFVFGKSGLGKTHLANAIGLKVKEIHQDTKTVLYKTAQCFQDDYVNAVKSNTYPDFINLYKEIDLLIVDDVQTFGQGNKQKTQEVLFDIIDYLHQQKRSVVLVGDKKPIDMEGILPKLMTRFTSMYITELFNPDFNTRQIILKNLIQREGDINAKGGIKIREDLVKYIAEKVTTNIRDLQWVLLNIIRQSILGKEDITLKLVQDIIGMFIKPPKTTHTIEDIQTAVCAFYNLSIDDIKSKSRKPEIVEPRQISIYFSKKFTTASVVLIGQQHGGKNHATVLYSTKTVDNLSSIDKEFSKKLNKIAEIIKNS